MCRLDSTRVKIRKRVYYYYYKKKKLSRRKYFPFWAPRCLDLRIHVNRIRSIENRAALILYLALVFVLIVSSAYCALFDSQLLPCKIQTYRPFAWNLWYTVWYSRIYYTRTDHDACNVYEIMEMRVIRVWWNFPLQRTIPPGYTVCVRV